MAIRSQRHILTRTIPKRSIVSSPLDRFLTVGMSNGNRVLLVVHADGIENVRIISARQATLRERQNYEEEIEKRVRGDEARREYDLSKLPGGIRGKYLARYREATNFVGLAPDVAEYFPDEQSVNAALRALIALAKKPMRPPH